ncbi:hypothetical protein [Halobacteriovorax sp. HLS]|uniref:hypothetical protein n=1 Tax=Halobacteriovorax sp. HLS TaxID=2234000 RepID=UPI000FD961C0|nr:hypothetical protein [Halobacteriovorax sp. HLS]
MRRKLRTILIVAFALCTHVSAKSERIYYKINHGTCRVKVWDTFKSEEDLKYKELVLSLLKERKYQASMLKEDRKIIAGDFHLKFSWQRSGENLFKDCSAELVLKKSKVDRAMNDDDISFEQSSKRAFPRHTPKGNERCRRAIQDVFNLLPHCIKRS